MGYIRHHAIIVTTFLEERAKEAHQKAVEIFGPIASEVVSAINRSIANNYHSFSIIVFPDGSKEGWDDSARGDTGRDIFRAWLESQRYEDGSSDYAWVEVQYGDEDHNTCIVHDSDEERRMNEEKDKGAEVIDVQAFTQKVEKRRIQHKSLG